MKYPLSDMPLKPRFAGCLPPRVSGSGFETPSWWSDIVSAGNEDGKIVFVSQGTAHVDYSQLIVPTMEAFRGRDSILVVATLGIRDAALGNDMHVPKNVRWTDFLASDCILPYADMFVQCGLWMHKLLLLCGDEQDVGGAEQGRFWIRP
ncbi:hypothetical protein ACHAQJ_004253 [Trichoderma viride]